MVLEYVQIFMNILSSINKRKKHFILNLIPTLFTMKYSTEKEFALEMDSKDPLVKYRKKFFIPKDKDGNDTIYFAGNSLGLQPITVKKYVEQELTDWQNLGVEGHFHAKNPWLPYHENLTSPIARIVGAQPIEVVTMNTLTVNIHLMMVSFYRPTPDRYKIVIEANAFPSDQYAVKSQLKFHGYDPKIALIEIGPRSGEFNIRTEDIEALIEQEGDHIALMFLGGINYYTGQAFEMERITYAAHRKKILVGFDLAHAVGNLVLKLHDWDVDFAVWCTYKYLNAGPGNIAGCFIHERFASTTNLQRFAGWWGQNKTTRFMMPPDFDPIKGAEGWQLSNPPILALAALRASLEIFNEVGMEALREKSILLTGYLEFLLNQYMNDQRTFITPRDRNQRGCQLSLLIKKDGEKIFRKLTESKIFCDWREPDVIRVAPTPLYNSFIDVYMFVNIFSECLI